MTLARACSLVLTLTLTGGAFGVPRPSAKSAFTLAMLRRDGVLVPFAVNDGAKWSSPWPVPKYKLEAPLAFADIPAAWWGRAAPATTWTAWPTGGDPITIHVTGPVVFNTHCLSNVGLRSDYKSPEPLPPLGQQHHPKDGVATSGDITVVPADVLGDAAPERSLLFDIIRPAVEKSETRTSGADWWERMYGWRGKRAANPLKLEVLCRSRSLGPSRTVYYFEVVREFPGLRPGSWSGIAPPEGGTPRAAMFLGLQIFSQGFVVTDGKSVLRDSIVSTFATVTRDAIDYGLPLGTIILDGRVCWIMQWSGRGRERYTIVEVTQDGIRRVVDVPGGAC